MLKYKTMIQLIFFLLSFSAFAEFRTFREAKKALTIIHSENPVTLYCGCRYSKKVVDLKSCGYIPHKKNAKNTTEMQFEHVVPAESFGKSFAEWRQGSPKCLDLRKKKSYKGRKCAQKNAEFAKMEADPYNLYPEVGELNQIRSNFSMAAIPVTERNNKTISFGGCQAAVHDRKFEPMDQAKGMVARIYMYMDLTYPGRGIISAKNEKLFETWDKKFPVTEWECRRARLIEAVHKQPNPILQMACLGMGQKKAP